MSKFIYTFFNFLFNLLSLMGGILVERPRKWLYVLLIVLSIISHFTALLVVISVLCYLYRRNRHAVF